MHKLKVWKFFSVWMVLVLVAALGAALVLASPVRAITPVYVDVSRPDDAGDGSSWATAKKTIQAGINAVDAGGTVYVAAGTYKVAGSWDGANCILITQDLILVGAGSGSTILDAEHTYSCVNGPPGCCDKHCTVIRNEATEVIMAGFTVKGGDWGIRNTATGMIAVFDDVVVTGNYGHGFVFEGNIGNAATFNNCKADANGDMGIYFNPACSATNVSLNNTNADGNKHIGFSCQGSISNLSISGGTFNNNTGGLVTVNCDTQAGPYYGFGIELRNCVGTIDGVTAQGNGFQGPNVVGGAYGDEGGAGIVVKCDTNIIITSAILQGNMNGLWIEDPDSVANWGAGCVGSVAMHYSIIVDNQEFGALNCTACAIDATNNWWGANDGPSASPGSGDKASANVDYNPWLVIGISANPSVIGAGGDTSTITADMTKNSAGQNTSAQGHIPDGTQIIFTTSAGSIGSTTATKTTTNGMATATLTPGAPSEATVCAAAPHGAQVSAQYKVCTTVDFLAPPRPPRSGVSPTTSTGSGSLNPPQMSVQYVSVNPQQTYANQPVTITTNVVNTGDEAGNLNVALKINGQLEQSRMVSVGPQGTQPVKFTVVKAQPGTYNVDIQGEIGSFTVLGAGSSTGSHQNGGLIALIAMVVLILATVVVLMVSFRRPA